MDCCRGYTLMAKKLRYYQVHSVTLRHTASRQRHGGSPVSSSSHGEPRQSVTVSRDGTTGSVRRSAETLLTERWTVDGGRHMVGGGRQWSQAVDVGRWKVDGGRWTVDSELDQRMEIGW